MKGYFWMELRFKSGEGLSGITFLRWTDKQIEKYARFNSYECLRTSIEPIGGNAYWFFCAVSPRNARSSL